MYGRRCARHRTRFKVSVLFNEPKLLKCGQTAFPSRRIVCFSALQRAEIAEIVPLDQPISGAICFSALQRAEIAEIGRQRAAAAPYAMFQCSSTSRNC